MEEVSLDSLEGGLTRKKVESRLKKSESQWRDSHLDRRHAHDESRSCVRRDGILKRISLDEVVFGDVVLVGPGQHIPADIRITLARDAAVDNSSLTGECDPFELTSDVSTKSDLEANNVAFYGTALARGFIEGIVVAIAPCSFMARIVAMAHPVESNGPFRFADIKYKRVRNRLRDRMVIKHVDAARSLAKASVFIVRSDAFLRIENTPSTHSLTRTGSYSDLAVGILTCSNSLFPNPRQQQHVEIASKWVRGTLFKDHPEAVDAYEDTQVAKLGTSDSGISVATTATGDFYALGESYLLESLAGSMPDEFSGVVQDAASSGRFLAVVKGRLGKSSIDDVLEHEHGKSSKGTTGLQMSWVGGVLFKESCVEGAKDSVKQCASNNIQVRPVRSPGVSSAVFDRLLSELGVVDVEYWQRQTGAKELMKRMQDMNLKQDDVNSRAVFVGHDVSDGPPLKYAFAGVALTGSCDTAKDAADAVLKTNSFADLVDCVMMIREAKRAGFAFPITQLFRRNPSH